MTATEPQRVVIVDDDTGMRQALRRLLDAAGYAANAFACTEDADRSGEVARAKCLVLDIHLSGKSGPHWYAAMDRSRPPAVFITAFDSNEARGSVAAAAGSACLIKPFEGSLLLDAIAQAIDPLPARTGPRL
jgi:FixJ family two-component response regulator